MRSSIFATAMAAALLGGAIPALAQQAASPQGSNPPQTTNRVNRTSHLGYVHMTAESDMFEIKSSDLALKKAQDPRVKAFARHMIRDHTQSSKRLETAISDQHMKARPPMELDVQKRQMMMQLGRLSGPEFDRNYMHMQVQGHKDALRLQRTYSQNGDNDTFKRLAASLVPMIQSHLDEAMKIAGTETSAR